MEALAIVFVFGFLFGFGALGEICLNKWMDWKYGPGSADLYRKNIPRARERSAFTGFGILIGFSAMFVPTSILGIVLTLPEGIRTRSSELIFVSMVCFLIGFSLLMAIYRIIYKAKKWFETPEGERNPDLFIELGSVEAVVRDTGKVSIGLYFFAAFVGFPAGAIIWLPFCFILPNLGFVAFILGAIGSCLAVWFISPVGVLYMFRRRVSKLGDLNTIYNEIEKQGESVADTMPYVLRISQNYIFLSTERYGNYIWKRRELNCNDPLTIDEVQSHQLSLNNNGKNILVQMYGDGALVVAEAIQKACMDF